MGRGIGCPSLQTRLANHELELRRAYDFFFTWQYDIRWAATMLRHEGTLAPVDRRSSTPGQLADSSTREPGP
jgi:hypothetical protein